MGEILAIGGNILYSMAYYLGSVYYALAGRILSGIGAANTSLTFPYVARTVTFVHKFYFEKSIQSFQEFNKKSNGVVFFIVETHSHFHLLNENPPAKGSLACRERSHRPNLDQGRGRADFPLNTFLLLFS